MIYIDTHCHWTTERCHMVADSPEELREAMMNLDIPHDRIQYAGTRDEHVDLTMAERDYLAHQGRMNVSIFSNEAMYRFVKRRTDSQYQKGVRNG